MQRREFAGSVLALAAASALPKISSASEKSPAKDADAILSELTLKEKVMLLSGRYTQDFAEKQKGYGLTAPFRTPGLERFGIPGIRFIDGPRGINFKGSTAFPVAMARGASWDPDLCRRVGDAMGREARAGGANFYGGVCVNLLRHPRGGRAQETFGEDPRHVGIMSVATAQGVQKHVMACAKHFCCNNNEDSRFYVNVKIDEQTLHELYLPHFRALADADIAAFMSAYNDVNGELCSQNEHLLTDILKQQWAWPGFVVSDFTFGVESTVKAANAGLDVEMPGTIFYGRKLLLAVRAGLVPEKNIDDSVRRLLRRQLEYLPLENAPGYGPEIVAGDEHRALAREAAQKSMVLLKNDGVLPLDRSSLKRVAVIGRLADVPNIGDFGSSSVRPPCVVTPLAGITEKLGPKIEVVHINGDDLNEVRKAVRESDAVIVVAGLSAEDEGEGGFPGIPGDRDRLELDPAREKMILAASLHPRSVVALMGGSAIAMRNWKDAAPAILMTWYPGMEGGHAIADVIFGDVNPSGRLPFMWPRSGEQCAPFSNWARSLSYSAFHGYRLSDKEGFSPEFPFGFGLSYTSFSYRNAELARADADSLVFKVDVANTGGRAGEETVQLYVGPASPAQDRPSKELKGFKKVALEPGECRAVEVELKIMDLARYQVGEKNWRVEEGEYIALIGSSADPRDLAAIEFQVQG